MLRARHSDILRVDSDLSHDAALCYFRRTMKTLMDNPMKGGLQKSTEEEQVWHESWKNLKNLKTCG